jgi:hypothetical protein
MDTQSLDQHQKEFLSSLFPLDDNPQFQYNFQPPNQLDLLGNMMAMQGIESPTALPQFAPHLLLEQQFKLSQLQQLQQLQNQIFQQQVSISTTTLPTQTNPSLPKIALISGQTGTVLPEPSSELQRDQPAQFNGLPTPGDEQSCVLCSSLLTCTHQVPRRSCDHNKILIMFHL